MAHPWHDLPNNPETADRFFNVVIEVPKGSRVKYELDKPTGLLSVSRVLYTSLVYPLNYGFLPRTYCEDDDPLDVLVLGEEPVAPLAIMQVRAIGVLHMADEGKRDDKIIAIHINDPAWAEFNDVSQLPKQTRRELQRFFTDYKVLENRETLVEEFDNATAALEVVRNSLAMYRREEYRLRGWK